MAAESSYATMLDQLTNLVKQNADGAIISNAAILNEKNEEVTNLSLLPIIFQEWQSDGDVIPENEKGMFN